MLVKNAWWDRRPACSTSNRELQRLPEYLSDSWTHQPVIRAQAGIQSGKAVMDSAAMVTQTPWIPTGAKMTRDATSSSSLVLEGPSAGRTYMILDNQISLETTGIIAAKHWQGNWGGFKKPAPISLMVPRPYMNIGMNYIKGPTNAILPAL